MTEKTPEFTILGAGLAGPLMAIYLAKAGYRVDLYEKRKKPKENRFQQGKSINLAISTRALFALEEVGLLNEVMGQVIPMRGRRIHSPNGKIFFQAYGANDQEVLHSISRAGLNTILLDAVELVSGIRIFFNQAAEKIDFNHKTIQFLHTATGTQQQVNFQTLIGADGAFSTVRNQMQKLDRFNYAQHFIDHGYKEFTIPAKPNGKFPIEKDALHIWPRGNCMIIALPNLDGSFTCTLFAPFQGENGFASLHEPKDVINFANNLFPDLVPLVPTLTADFFKNPTGSLTTIKCYPWAYQNKTILIGDACHAIVPFYGQGINAGFEDCTLLMQSIKKNHSNLALAFTEYQQSRKPDVDTLAEISLNNYIEMRSSVKSPLFLSRMFIENLLHRFFPKWFYSLHSIISFTRMPYGQAVKCVEKKYRIIGITISLLIFIIFIIIV